LSTKREGSTAEKPQELEWWSIGSESAEFTLLLVAGTGYSGRTWPSVFLDELMDLTRIVMFDHRGTGNSPGTPGSYTTQMFARDASALVEKIGVRPHLLGHSMGGRVAQWMALESQDLFESLILVASGTGETHTNQSRGIPPSTVLGILDAGYEGYVRDLQRQTFFTPAFLEMHGDVVSQLGEAFWRNRPALADYLKHVEARQSHAIGRRLADIAIPTAVIVGSEDTGHGATGSHFGQSLELHQAIPGSTFAEIAECSHGVFWERPRSTASAIRDWILRREMRLSY